MTAEKIGEALGYQNPKDAILILIIVIKNSSKIFQPLSN
jgi:hypothetical protein